MLYLCWSMRKAAENRFCEINRESCVIQFENGLTGFTLERLLRKITCLKVYDKSHCHVFAHIWFKHANRQWRSNQNMRAGYLLLTYYLEPWRDTVTENFWSNQSTGRSISEREFDRTTPCWAQHFSELISMHTNYCNYFILFFCFFFKVLPNIRASKTVKDSLIVVHLTLV